MIEYEECWDLWIELQKKKILKNAKGINHLGFWGRMGRSDGCMCFKCVGGKGQGTLLTASFNSAAAEIRCSIFLGRFSGEIFFHLSVL